MVWATTSQNQSNKIRLGFRFQFFPYKDLRVPFVAMNSHDVFYRLIQRHAGISCEPSQRTPAVGEDNTLRHTASTANSAVVLNSFQPKRLHLTFPARRM